MFCKRLYGHKVRRRPSPSTPSARVARCAWRVPRHPPGAHTGSLPGQAPKVVRGVLPEAHSAPGLASQGGYKWSGCGCRTGPDRADDAGCAVAGTHQAWCVGGEGGFGSRGHQDYGRLTMAGSQAQFSQTLKTTDSQSQSLNI
jgi:hypothetical protein